MNTLECHKGTRYCHRGPVRAQKVSLRQILETNVGHTSSAPFTATAWVSHIPPGLTPAQTHANTHAYAHSHTPKLSSSWSTQSLLPRTFMISPMQLFPFRLFPFFQGLSHFTSPFLTAFLPVLFILFTPQVPTWLPRMPVRLLIVQHGWLVTTTSINGSPGIQAFIISYFL